jgi:hypothetical protein
LTSSNESQRLITAARTMLRPDRFTAGLWPRGVALLTRQALESAMDELWLRRAPEIAQASARAQLLCLRSYFRQDDLTERVTYVWGALSRACHHHAYELPATAPELEAWIRTVEEFASAVAEIRA